MMDYLDEVFGEAGVLAGRFPGYKPREGQVALARAVDAALSKGTHLLAEAPTGVGKSLAYSVPAAHHAKRRGETVVIVTANIALQEQLVNKDLPLLKEILPWDFSFALLKGRNNYLCLNQLEEGVRGKLHADDREMNDQIIDWAARTEKGDVSELPFEPPGRLWSRFSVSSDECLGSDCPNVGPCFAERARDAANEADIVVTNYHLFFADMKVREATNGFARVLPDYYAAILDEGHKAVDIARDFFGFSINEGSIRWATSMIKGDLKYEIEQESKSFFAALGNYKRTPKYKARIREPNAADAEELKFKIGLAEGEYLDRLRKFPPPKEMTPQERKEYRKLSQRLVRATKIREQISAAMCLYTLPSLPWREHPEHKGWWYSDPAAGGDNSVKEERYVAQYNSVYFIEDESSNPTLSSKPISVAKLLQQHLFYREEPISVSVTSATLVARGSFDYIADDLGVVKPTTLVSTSPFDFAQQALLVLPQDVPEPNDPKFTIEAAQKCAETIELARGRTLALFTSYKNMNAAHERALRTGYRILRQGDMPRTKLIEEFKKDVNSVLMGVESFWAGVDVPGESLSCVFIDKLPFVTPDDPVMDALSERDEDWFKKYSVPRAIISFKQGFGRLIRSIEDRGVVVVLDRRIVTKYYGVQFLYSLPAMQKSYNLGDVRRFLDREPLVINAAPSPSATSASLFDRA